MEIKTIPIPAFVDKRGSLSFLENTATKDGLPFCCKRVFWIYQVPEGAERGGHAHRTCAEFFIAVHGSCDIELCEYGKTVNVHLDNPAEGLVIPPMVWCRLYNFSADFVGLCLASQSYSQEGYINNYDDFLRESESYRKSAEDKL